MLNKDQQAKRDKKRIDAGHLLRNDLFNEIFVKREQAIISELARTKVNWFTRRKRDALLLEFQTIRGIRLEVEALSKPDQPKRTTAPI